jgi:transcription elongation factor Elf1
MTGTKTRGYLLKFRCLNCGRYEAFACYPSEAVMPMDQIKARIYKANCKACGWNGEVCGVSALQIYYSLELDVKLQGKDIEQKSPNL